MGVVWLIGLVFFFPASTVVPCLMLPSSSSRTYCSIDTRLRRRPGTNEESRTFEASGWNRNTNHDANLSQQDSHSLARPPIPPLQRITHSVPLRKSTLTLSARGEDAGLLPILLDPNHGLRAAVVPAAAAPVTSHRERRCFFRCCHEDCLREEGRPARAVRRVVLVCGRGWGNDDGSARADEGVGVRRVRGRRRAQVRRRRGRPRNRRGPGARQGRRGRAQPRGRQASGREVPDHRLPSPGQ
jgi:hypothetical protein